MFLDKFEDRYVENIDKEKDTIICHKCNRYYYPEIGDISKRRPSVYCLYCTACRIKNVNYQKKQALKKLLIQSRS